MLITVFEFVSISVQTQTNQPSCMVLKLFNFDTVFDSAYARYLQGAQNRDLSIEYWTV